jgi:hypothetical protein
MYTSSTSNEKSVTPITENDWHLTMARTGVAESPIGTNPDVQVRLINGQDRQGGALQYSDFLITPYLKSFEFSMQVYWRDTLTTGGGDSYTVKFGNAKSRSVFFNFWSYYTNNGLSGEGVYIFDETGKALIKSTVTPSSKGPGQNQWFPVKIIYNKNAATTWTILVNNVVVLTYTDPTVLTENSWQKVANNAGVTVSAWSGGGLHMELLVRKLGLTYITPISANTVAMPPKFYPSADDSTFSSSRAAYARTVYPRIANDATASSAEQITKQKRIYNRHDASSRMERLKLQAIGESSMRLKDSETLSFKAPNVNDARDALRRTRSHGYVVPSKNL